MQQNHEYAIESIDEALELINSYSGKVEDFELSISTKLLDNVGVSMAIITDKILSKGWIPQGYREETGKRIYRYTDM